jgi:5-methylcytosine-specific restriction endonuclease McrA
MYAISSALTKITGIAFEVDHIVPLQGRNVSGLHVETNLQILAAENNRAKFNTWQP